MSKVVLFEEEMDCCGCTACKSICPKQAVSMIENDEGFLYPVIDDGKCIACGICKNVCPISDFNKPEKFDDDKIHIAAISLSHTENFGAKLVTYALKKKIEEIIPNSKVEVVEFFGDVSQDGLMAYALKRVKEQGLIKPLLHYSLAMLSRKSNKDSFKKRNENFSFFNQSHLPVSLQTKKVSQFRNFVNGCDAVVVGSDIVFRPEYAQLHPMVYFLGCINNDKVVKLSYAASIGTNSEETLKPLEHIYKDGLKNFDYISTREDKSREFLQKLTDKPVELCCDPVLLCDAKDFSFESSFKAPKRKYIFLYILDRNKYAIKYAKRLAKRKNLDIYYFAEKDIKGTNIYNVFTDGPSEFVERIKNAEYVITNSFHSIVFSILFKKSFVASMRTRQSLKITNILEIFGLENRAVLGKSKFDIDTPIDWVKVDDIRIKCGDKLQPTT